MAADAIPNRKLFDTHVHTAEVSPCGQVSGGEIARMYKGAGYDGIVITDHLTSRLSTQFSCRSWSECVASYLSGFRAAQSEGAEIGLTVLWGLELTLDYGPPGDFLVYGLDEEFLIAHSQLCSLDLPGVRDLIAQADALIVQAHPFRPGHTLAPTELLDGFEVINGNPRHPYDTSEAFRVARLHGLLRTAGSDAHRPEDVGRAGITLPKSPRSIGEFVSMLRTGTAEIRSFDPEMIA
jgi:predicted metal-dependent phosphoesterase TrpH